MKPVYEKAYAKINLFLDVLRKRNDGYHDIGTIFQTISCWDTVVLEKSKSGISLSDQSGVCESVEDNLAWKAAKIFLDEAQLSGGVKISLDKNLPAGAGMGGGSADAAAVLRGMNRLFGNKYSASDLEKMGTPLGADVPFMIQGGTALAEGIGEELTQVELDWDPWVLVVTPEEFVSTGKAYGALTPSGDERWLQVKNQILNSGSNTGSATELEKLLFNKFEEYVFENYPGITSLSTEMKSLGAQGVLLSGSGASVFALFDSILDAQNCLKELTIVNRFEKITKFVKNYWKS